MFNELESIRRRLLAYIESAYHLSDPQLVQLRRELLEQPKVLCHSPFIESSARYKIGNPYNQLKIPPEAEQLLSFLATDASGKVVFPKPYEHQAEALESVLADELRHTIVTTGTGSGKTETFLLPIMGRLGREAAASPASFQTRAVRALLLYPMNALVNDQLSRLRRLFGAPATRNWFKEHGGRPVKFGRYTSRTPFPGMIPDDSKKLSSKLAGLRFFVDLERKAASGSDPQATQLLKAMRSMGKWPAKDVGDHPGLANWLGSGGAWKDGSGRLRRAIERGDEFQMLGVAKFKSALLAMQLLVVANAFDGALIALFLDPIVDDAELASEGVTIERLEEFARPFVLAGMLGQESDRGRRPIPFLDLLHHLHAPVHLGAIGADIDRAGEDRAQGFGVARQLIEQERTHAARAINGRAEGGEVAR